MKIEKFFFVCSFVAVIDVFSEFFGVSFFLWGGLLLDGC